MGGHAFVTKGLVEGLNKIGYKEFFNYRPLFERDIADHVHVLAGVETLRYAIELKKKGKIHKLTAGPNIVMFSDEYDGIIADENVDLYLQPSPWAVNIHLERNNKLRNRCVAWPVGIDIERVKRMDGGMRSDENVLVYYKSNNTLLANNLIYLLKQYGYNPLLIEYGKYEWSNYLELLEKSRFMVTVTESESQGIFLAEAWAMDVPTICYDPAYQCWMYKNEIIEISPNVSTCPYLSAQTGVRFTSAKEFNAIMQHIDEISRQFAPREWVIQNMSDKVCAQRFLDIVGRVQN